MRDLRIYIEICGKQEFVGHIIGNDYSDAQFCYEREYMNSEYGHPISISLPFQDEKFSVQQTKNFFEGLLPEGFSRRAVANWAKVDEDDYLSILSALGRECLGAIMVVEDETSAHEHYEKLGIDRVKDLASEGATSSTQILMETHLSLTGASGKVGLYYDKENDTWFLLKGNAPSTHIVKQSHVRLDKIVLNEQLCILTAKNLGIEVPESFILNLGEGRDEEVLYATERYDRKHSNDRKIDGMPAPMRLHQEDFAQALGIASSDKYEKDESGYLKRMFELIAMYSTNPLEDQVKLMERIVFNYLIGNTDCHIKNYSLLYSEDMKEICLAPAYDIVSTRVYKMTSDMSFYIGGELDIDKITRKNFEIAANDIKMNHKMVMNIFDNTVNKFEKSLKEAADVLVNMGYTDAKDISEKILKMTYEGM